MFKQYIMTLYKTTNRSNHNRNTINHRHYISSPLKGGQEFNKIGARFDFMSQSVFKQMETKLPEKKKNILLHQMKNTEF